MFHCPGCWETPCLCADGRGYRHLSINELQGIRKALAALIDDKAERGIDHNKREFPKTEA